jgi:uncharacterized protein
MDSVSVTDAQEQAKSREDDFLKAQEIENIKFDDSIADNAFDAGKSFFDTFVNAQQGLGVTAAGSSLSTGSYTFNPITRNRTLMEWIHRGSWLGGVAIDVIAEDMTRAGVSMTGTLNPHHIEAIREEVDRLKIWDRVKETIQWARLYGGAIAVFMVKGQSYDTPLRIESIGENQFKGLYVFDRWMLEPSLDRLVTEPGPDIGLPMFYTIRSDAPALRNMKIHYSRVIRLEGIHLPYQQRLIENLWGLSVIERIYDRMISFDGAYAGLSQLVYKAYIRTYKLKGLRDVLSRGGPALEGLKKFAQMMRSTQSNEGVTFIDSEDEYEGHSTSAFGGLADTMKVLNEQIAGALQIPLVRLFGQSPSGFNGGDSDIRLYHEGIQQKQNDELKQSVIKIYRVVAQSMGIKLPKGFSVKFNPLWQLDEKDKGGLTKDITKSITTAVEAGLISKRTGVMELKKSAHVTGIFDTITPDDIESSNEKAESLEEKKLKASTKIKSQQASVGKTAAKVVAKKAVKKVAKKSTPKRIDKKKRDSDNVSSLTSSNDDSA